ncbi:hypothetical protein ACOMHN_065687 [Nucella lapillus]
MTASAVHFIFILATLCACSVFGQLVVNVKNKGEEVIVESIHANTTSDTVTLEYLNTDGTLITLFIDFKSEAQLFRVIMPGEEELGVTEPQTICFITRFSHSDFISSDAMSKLRQKNPTAIRTPEEERAAGTYTHDLRVDLVKSHVISPHIYNVCREAVDAIYFTEGDLHTISRSLSKDYTTMMSAMERQVPAKHARCMDTQEMDKPCLCRFDMCIGWYPCGLKYCHGKDTIGKVVSYRCGIKTCKRCLTFFHVVDSKRRCLWDK